MKLKFNLWLAVNIFLFCIFCMQSPVSPLCAIFLFILFLSNLNLFSLSQLSLTLWFISDDDVDVVVFKLDDTTACTTGD